jgi:acetylglutamate kinase
MIKIYKIGGGILDNPPELERFLVDFSRIKQKKILVHGGGKEANQLLKKLNIEPNMVEGRRVTDHQTLDVVTQLYAGKLNKFIVAFLQKLNSNCLGLSGADANVIRAKKRPVKTIDYGFVGDLDSDSVNYFFIQSILDLGITPVFCAITHDGNGQLLNTNADTIASQIAISMAKIEEVELHFCFDKIGVLQDINDEKSLIPTINSISYKKLIEDEIIADGMLPKLENAFSVLQNGVKKVCLEHPKNINNEIKTILCI